jgi:hypothetical protein
LGVDENYWTTHAADLFKAKTETLQRSVGQGVRGKLSSKRKHVHAYSVEEIQEHVKKSRTLARSKAWPIIGLNAMCSAALTCVGSDSEASGPSNDSGEAGDDAVDGLVAQAIPVAASRSESAYEASACATSECGDGADSVDPSPRKKIARKRTHDFGAEQLVPLAGDLQGGRGSQAISATSNSGGAGICEQEWAESRRKPPGHWHAVLCPSKVWTGANLNKQLAFARECSRRIAHANPVESGRLDHVRNRASAICGFLEQLDQKATARAPHSFGASGVCAHKGGVGVASGVHVVWVGRYVFRVAARPI